MRKLFSLLLLAFLFSFSSNVTAIPVNNDQEQTSISEETPNAVNFDLSENTYQITELESEPEFTLTIADEKHYGRESELVDISQNVTASLFYISTRTNAIDYLRFSVSKSTQFNLI